MSKKSHCKTHNQDYDDYCVYCGPPKDLEESKSSDTQTTETVKRFREDQRDRAFHNPLLRKSL